MFEDGLYELLQDDDHHNHCEIHVFDPDPRYARPDDPVTKNIHYHAWGLKSSYASTPEWGGFEFLTIQETLQRLNHTSRRIDIFKIDCEGCEWSSYRDWLDPNIADIRNILIETHMMKQGIQTGSQFFESFLDRGFVPYSKEANTHPAAPPGRLFEWGFIRLHPDFLGRTAKKASV